VEHVTNARACKCVLYQGGETPLKNKRHHHQEGHEAEPHRGGRGAAEGGRARVEAQAPGSVRSMKRNSGEQ
jgi:hypothetical protein